MKNPTHQVVILDNLTSPYIQQAIIFLKDIDPAIHSKAVAEAEKIVQEYIEGLKKDEHEVTLYTRPLKPNPSRKNTGFAGFVTGVLISAAALLIFWALH